MSFAPEWFFGRDSAAISLGTSPEPSGGVLLYGGPRTGKTSLLFQLAVHHAQRGTRVVFVCNRMRLYASPPVLAISLDSITEEALSRIEFKYIESDSVLRQYLAGLVDLPGVIIVDDMSAMCDASKHTDAVLRTLALLHDTVKWLRGRHGVTPCMFLVADTAVGDQGPWGSPLSRSHCLTHVASLEESEDGLRMTYAPMRVRAGDAPCEAWEARYVVTDKCLTLLEVRPRVQFQ